MSKKIFEYQGYSAHVHYSAEDGCFCGKVEGIKSLLLFEGESVDALFDDFCAAVDEYLEHCAARGVAPDVPVTPNVRVRLPIALHTKARDAASAQGVSLNRFISDAVEKAV